jgi:hypothetical protein
MRRGELAPRRGLAEVDGLATMAYANVIILFWQMVGRELREKRACKASGVAWMQRIRVVCVECREEATILQRLFGSGRVLALPRRRCNGSGFFSTLVRKVKLLPRTGAERRALRCRVSLAPWFPDRSRVWGGTKTAHFLQHL